MMPTSSMDVRSARLLGGNPVTEVRSNISKLTARARQLMDNADTRVVRSRQSVLETSRNVSDETARASGVQSGAAQAPVELFMADLRFNVQEQQRLLSQLVAHQPSVSAGSGAAGSVAPMGGAVPGAGAIGGVAGGGGVGGIVATPFGVGNNPQSDLEAFLSARRSAVVRECIDESHRFVVEQTWQHTDAVVRSAWEKYSFNVADALDASTTKSNAMAAGYRNAASSSSSAAARGALNNSSALAMTSSRDGTDATNGAFAALLNSTSNSALSARTLNQIAKFASIVDTQPYQRWLSEFTSFVAEQTLSQSDQMVSLWYTVEELLLPLVSGNRVGVPKTTDKDVMALVASSRALMERKAFQRILSETMRMDAHRLEEAEGMHASRVKGVIEQYASTSNQWVHIYLAMRIGRYDTAVLIAHEMGKGALITALTDLAGTSSSNRNSTGAAHPLRALYKEPATKEDPYRRLVLFILLVGQTDESNAETVNVLQNLVGKVSSTLEDMLWARITCVRFVDRRSADSGTKADLKVQSLVELQTMLRGDLQEMVTLVQGNLPRLASLLMHALLPSSALRLLVEETTTYVDGVHMSMCFHSLGMLQCTSAEVSLDLAKHLTQYCATLILELETRMPATRSIQASIFNYFLKTDSVDAFVDMCCNEVVCTRLFGQLSSREDGALLRGTPSPDLLGAMERIGNENDARGQSELAVHMFIVLEEAATVAGSPTQAALALRRAVQILRPVLSQNAHRPPVNQSTSALVIAAKLQYRLQRSQHVVPAAEIEAFYTLCYISEFFSRVASGDLEAAANAFCALPFVPHNDADIARCVRALDDVPDDVRTAVSPTVVAGMQSLMGYAQALQMDRRNNEASAVLLQARAVLLWEKQWKRNMGLDISAHMATFERALQM